MYRTLGASIAMAAAVAFTGSANASSFPSRDINFIIPYGPGGGFDTYVRKIAPVLERHLPNKVRVIPRNDPGAGGRKALTTLYRERPDGYTIAIFNMPGMLLDKIQGQKTSYDIDNFTWLGRIGVSAYALTVGGKSDIKTWEDLKNRSLKYAIVNWSSGAYVSGRILAEAMGLDVTFLPGYKGSADISLSMVRGDTDISLFNAVSAGRWAKDGDIRILLSLEKESPWPDVPTVVDAGYPEMTTLTVDRYVGGAPGLPEDVANILSESLMKALNDPEIQEWKKTTGAEIDPLTGPQAAAELKKMAEFYTRYKEALAKR